MVIYEMMTARPAGRFPRLSKSASQVVRDPTLRVLNRLALRACQRDPKRRFPDARAMLAEMQASDPELAARRRRVRRRVVFRHDDRGELDAGRIDFAKKREIRARWNPDS
jgi:hypothetical protein